MRAGRWLPALGLLLCLACACSRRPHVAVSGDGGPAVVVVERRGDGALGAKAAASWTPRATIEYVEEREPDDDLGRAQPFEHPRGIHGRLSSPPGSFRADVDVYQWVVNTEVRSLVRIELTAPPEVILEVLDRNGETLVRGGGGEHVFPNLAVSPGETWFLRVRGDRKAGPAGAEYRLAMSARALAPGDEEEPNDAARRATALQRGVDYTGYFGWPHDDDWLKLPDGLAAGSTLRLELSPVEGVVPAVRLRDLSGSLLLEARGIRAEELRLRNLPASSGGLFVVRADAGRNVDVPWQLRWSIEPPLEGAEIEPNHTLLTATRIDVQPAEGGGRATVAGFLWPGDVDVYRVRATAPGLLDVEVQPPDGVDLRLESLDAVGVSRGRIDKGGPGKAERLARLPVSGEALLRVSARAGDTAFDAPYQLSVSLSPLPPGAAPDGGATVVNP